MRVSPKRFLEARPFAAGVAAALAIMAGGVSLVAAANHVHPFITGSIDYENTTSGPVIYGLQSGTGIGVEGATNTTAAAGAIALQGFGTSTTHASVGVNGAVDGPGSTGLIGNANDASGAASVGLEGFSKNGEGVFAETLSTSFPGLRSLDGSAFYDVRLSDAPDHNGLTAFINTGSGGAAVEGDDTVTSSTVNIGVLGTTASGDFGVEGVAAGDAPAGVFGINNATAGPKLGVEGESSSGIAIFGTSATNIGVEGVSTSSNGLLGTSDDLDGTDGFTYNPSSTQAGRSGVYGLDASSDSGSGDFGVTGQSSDGDGVQGNSTNQQGVLGTSEFYAGVFGSSQDDVGTWGVGEFGAVGQCESGGDDEFYGQNSSFSGIFTVDCNGTPSEVIRSRHNLYANPTFEKSTQSVIEDYGEAQLVDGAANVRLDPSFADTIADGAPYLVFVTPDGDTKGLYVAQKTMTGFEVREVQGGRSTLTFDYRIVGHPADSTYTRMALSSSIPHLRVPVDALERARLAPAEIAHRVALARADRSRAALDSKGSLEAARQVHPVKRMPMYEPHIGADGKLYPGAPYNPNSQR